MIMETRKNLAAEKKRCGSHNCAQAILCTYADKVGIDEETARNIANSFGAGIGNMEGTCGALVGAGITLGMATKVLRPNATTYQRSGKRHPLDGAFRIGKDLSVWRFDHSGSRRI